MYVMASFIKEFGLCSQLAQNYLSLVSGLGESHTPYVHNVCSVTFICWEARVNLMHASQLSDKRMLWIFYTGYLLLRLSSLTTKIFCEHINNFGKHHKD